MRVICEGRWYEPSRTTVAQVLCPKGQRPAGLVRANACKTDSQAQTRFRPSRLAWYGGQIGAAVEFVRALLAVPDCEPDAGGDLQA